MLTKSEFFTKFTTVLPGSNFSSSPIYFTPISMDSLEEMHSYSLKEQFYDYFEFGPFQNIKETESYIEKLLGRMTGDEDSRVTSYWFVRRKSDDSLIGSAGLIDFNFARQSIEWGYGIDPDLWGHGYVLKIQEILKDYVFNILELNRIHGVTMSNNLRTIESIKAAGMTHEGIAKEHYCKEGKFIDGWRYGMTRSMYESHKPISGKTLNGSDLLSSIVSLVASVFPEEEITEESSMFDTGSWDSLGHMQVIIALKEEMNIELSPSHIAEATSIELIASIIDEAS
ncbi:GNAT family N-acetyltransferase [Alphaproteobacteria bacterium]|nr:GNAT family N-acetyltransferase [Alphaproteobacteria bacterium]